MVPLPTVQAHNATLSSLPPNLVAIFVGGTSGIGHFTLLELARHTTSPHIYLIGRNASAASSITASLQTINPLAKTTFIENDVSQLRNVDAVCDQILAKEKHVNLLFMTCGYLTFKGQDLTPENLDRKFALHYYTRMRFIARLQPLLTTAAQSHTLSRVVSVLDPQAGLRLTPNWTDLSLTSTYSLKNCMVHASAMNSLAALHLSKQNPGTSYIHAYPSGVETGVTRDLFGVFDPLAKVLLGLGRRWMVKPQESGERHLFAATAGRYAAREESGKGGWEEKALGSDGVKGSGSYLLNWDGEVLADMKKAKGMREEGRERVVWEHTEEVFRKICEGEGKY